MDPDTLPPKRPLWVTAFILIAAALLLLVLVLVFTGGGGSHGPGRHM